MYRLDQRRIVKEGKIITWSSCIHYYMPSFTGLREILMCRREECNGSQHSLAFVFQLWFKDLYHQHNLGACQKGRISDPLTKLLNENLSSTRIPADVNAYLMLRSTALEYCFRTPPPPSPPTHEHLEITSEISYDCKALEPQLDLQMAH